MKKAKWLLAILGIIIVLTALVAPEKISNTKDWVAEKIMGTGEESFKDMNEEEVPSEEEQVHTEADDSINFEECTVSRVIDGDTIAVYIGGSQFKVRMIGIESPESVHPDESRNSQMGIEAANFTKSQLPEGKTVYLEKDKSDTDAYDRILRYVWLEKPSSENPTDVEIKEKMLNAIILDNGYAASYTYEPDVKYSSLFDRIANEAKQNQYGIWGEQNKSGYQNEQNTNINYAEEQSVPTPELEPEPQTYQTTSASPNDPAYLYSNGRPIGNKNSGIYHNEGQDSYHKVLMKNAVIFDSEEEAQNAGFRRAKR